MADWRGEVTRYITITGREGKSMMRRGEFVKVKRVITKKFFR